MIAYKLEGAAEIIRALDATNGRVAKEFVRALDRAGVRVQGQSVRNYLSGQALKRRTGTLATSIRREVDGKRMLVRVGTNVVYAAIHEYGGTIRPKNASKLAIPIGNLKGYASTHQGLRIAMSMAKKNVILVDQDGKPQYVLKSSVTMPKRPWLAPAYEDSRGAIEGEFVEALNRVLTV